MISFDERMTLGEIEALNPGDGVHVYHAKDDDPAYVRSNHEHDVVEIDEDGALWTKDSGGPWEWDLADYDPEVRGVDTCRGYAYFRKHGA